MELLVQLISHLTMEDWGNGEVPSSVSGHYKAQKGPDSVVVKRRNKDCGGTTSSEDVSPSPLVQIVIYVIYVAATNIDIYWSLYFLYFKALHLKKYRSKLDTVKARVRDACMHKCVYRWYLAQAISWITDPNRRNVQLNANPTFLQCFPSNPSRTSNH